MEYYNIEELLNQNEYEKLDFKQIYWVDNISMVHDILCMTNSVVNGYRYIVFGIEDKTKRVIGISDDSNIKNKQQITDCLSNSGINVVPSFEIHTREYNNLRIDILVIPEPLFRPVYLTRDKTIGKKTIRAGVIYTRDNDTNTPLNGTASPEKLTLLWSFRFGLNQAPMDRFKEYLMDVNGWEEIEENHWYYRKFPEFTIVRFSEIEEVEVAESWVRAATNPKSYFYKIAGKYHQTILWNEIIFYYDEMRYQIPNPDLKLIGNKPNNKNPNYFYSFTADSFKFLLLNFLCDLQNDNVLSDRHFFSHRGGSMPLILFSDDFERTNFIDYLSQNPKFLTDYNQKVIHQDISEKDSKVVNFCYRVKDLYEQWKTR